jgi:hypothetical protein
MQILSALRAFANRPRKPYVECVYFTAFRIMDPTQTYPVAVIELRAPMTANEYGALTPEQCRVIARAQAGNAWRDDWDELPVAPYGLAG